MAAEPGAGIVPEPLRTRAPAKVNLTLHVKGRRADGYHDLESLTAFAGCGDTLALVPGPDLSLHVEGPSAGLAGAVGDNLVLKAARACLARYPDARAGAFHLVKRLPVAAGLGGGSADAAAALRLIARLNGLAVDDPLMHAIARETGADVPVCLASRARMMQGVGEQLGPPLDLPPLFAVLVNPGVAVPTADVFRELGLKPGEVMDGSPHPPVRPGMDHEELIAILREARNDLEPPAIRLFPIIGKALDLLRQTPGCRLARMSGSGATVFGLYGDCHQAARAARLLRDKNPGWWIRATVLR